MSISGIVVELDAVLFVRIRKLCKLIWGDYYGNKWGYPITLSCNFRGEVWVPTSYGYTPSEGRHYLPQEFVGGIIEVVNRVVDRNQLGGRFHIDVDGVYLADGGYKIADVELH